MRYFIAIIIFSFIIILSCNTSKEKEKLLTTANLPSKEYTINIDKDTILQTENGALLKIPKGALRSEIGKTVTLEIKEAYSLSQMIKAGLVTQSNGESLSSGGMIYVNATAGQKVTITQAIKVAIPADYLQKGMQLYRGDESNGKINWISPTPLQENKQLTSIDTGQILFQTNCASCHTIGKDLTGPDLAHFIKRFPNFGSEGDYAPFDHNFAYLYPNVRLRPFSFTFSGDSPTIKRKLDSSFAYVDTIGWHSEPYNCNLIKLYGGVLGPQFNFSLREWQQIYNYIQNESDRRNLPFPGHDYLRTCIDSCNLYKEKVRDLHQQKMLSKFKKKYSIEDNGPLVKITPDTTWKVNNDTETIGNPLPPVINVPFRIN